MNRIKHKTISAVTCLLVLLGLLTPVLSQAETGNVVLWNKLGANAEVSNSMIGEGFGIHSDTQGGVLYVPGKFGNALATTGGEVGGGGYLTMSPDKFYAPDRSKGTVAVWIQKRIQKFIPFQSPLLCIFGCQPYDGVPTPGIYAAWSDGYTWSGGMTFLIFDGQADHQINDLGWDTVPVGTWVHETFVWDINGIGGTTDRMRIYRDGLIVAKNSAAISRIFQDNYPVKILGHHAYSRFAQPTAYLDNLVVYDYAKTDFSDRFIENPAECEVGGLPELSAVISKKSGTQNARIWTITLANSSRCSAENAQIDNLVLSPLSGSNCRPVITAPASFPLGVGNIQAGAQVSGTTTINFSGCPNNAKFKVNIPFSSNSGEVTGSKTLTNQFR